MLGQRITVEGEIFLGSVEEQNRFRALLDEMGKQGVSPLGIPPRGHSDWAYVVLIYGIGGMGKTTLCKRLRDIAQEDSYKGKFHICRMDWEINRERDRRLVSRESVSLEAVLDNLYIEFRDAGFGDKFDPFEEEKKRSAEAKAKVEKAVSSLPEESDRYAPLRWLMAEGIVGLFRYGVPGGTLLPLEKVVAALDVVLKSGTENIAHLRGLAEEWLRSRLEPEEYDLIVLPYEALARAFAEGVRAVANGKPLIIFMDSYEVVDRVDPLLRYLIQLCGPRVIWVLSGRDNLAESRYYEGGYFLGYQGEAPSERLRTFPLSQAERLEFSGETLNYVLFGDDYPVTALTAPWQDTTGPSERIFAVQTGEKVIERCILMTTDPGDLVFDPTCVRKGTRVWCSPTPTLPVDAPTPTLPVDAPTPTLPMDGEGVF
ncbi:MAG: hypothetical protein ACUVV0_10160, partial [Anaerolineae bacterium]